MNRRTEILSICPELRCGGEHRWLAVSPQGAALGIGVTGRTESEAREKFQAELAAWAALSELPDRQIVTPKSSVRV